MPQGNCTMEICFNSQQKHMLWVVERFFELTKYMFKLLGKKIITLIVKKIPYLVIWSIIQY